MKYNDQVRIKRGFYKGKQEFIQERMFGLLYRLSMRDDRYPGFTLWCWRWSFEKLPEGHYCSMCKTHGRIIVRNWRNGRTAQWIVRLLTLFSEWLESNYDVKHEVTVQLYDWHSIDGRNGESLGVFAAPSHGIKNPQIWIATRWRRWGINKHKAVYEFLTTMAHEFVHYERYRDGRGIVPHNGLPQRTDAIVRRYDRECFAVWKRKNNKLRKHRHCVSNR